MHEMSIAQSIVELVTDAIHDQPGVRVSVVSVRLGPLSGVVSAALQTAFKQAAIAAGLGGAALRIEQTSVTIFCPQCDGERPTLSPREMRCSVCGTASHRVLGGREMEVVSIELLDPPAVSGR
jgi:hydrogenase nickel incorporation protein HypA/HybF